jgi:hypothetical protein
MNPATPGFWSRLRPLSVLDLEHMTPAQLQRREAEEMPAMGRPATAQDTGNNEQQPTMTDEERTVR